ncbi:MAG: hypothetical protein ABL971_10905 [Vicinamibacterales bacterium]
MRPRLAVSLVAALVTVSLAAGPATQTPPNTARIMSMSTFANLFVVVGDGTNSIAIGGDDGVAVVDTKVPGWGRTMAEKIELGTEAPITTIINTSVHLAGSNPEITTAREIVAHERTRAHMAALEAFKGPGARFLPNRTFQDTLSLPFKTRGDANGTNRIDLYYFGPARTDGDTVVVFPSFGMAFLGELFPSKSAPAIDTARGGSAVALPETLDKAVRALGAIKGVTILVPGRAAPPPTPYVMSWMTLKDLQEYADFNRAFLASVKASLAAGRSVDEAMAGLSLPERFKAYGMDRARENVLAIYAELKK